MKALKKVFDNLEKVILSLLLLAVLIILAYQVFSRYVLNAVPQWPEELARFLFIWFIFLSASYAGQQNAHIRIETLANVYPPAIRRYVAKIGETVWLAFNLYMVYASSLYTYDIFLKKQYSVGARIEFAYIYAAIPIGFLMLSIRIMINMFTKRGEKVRNLEEEVCYEVVNDEIIKEEEEQ